MKQDKARIKAADDSNEVFSDFAKYAWAWENGKSAVETAEDLKLSISIS